MNYDYAEDYDLVKLKLYQTLLHSSCLWGLFLSMRTWRNQEFWVLTHWKMLWKPSFPCLPAFPPKSTRPRCWDPCKVRICRFHATEGGQGLVKLGLRSGPVIFTAMHGIGTTPRGADVNCYGFIGDGGVAPGGNWFNQLSSSKFN